MGAEKKVCPCCGMDYIREEYDICLTCGWEYDPVQNDKPDRKGGANSDSLNEHRDWYRRMYTKDKNSNGVILGKAELHLIDSWKYIASTRNAC